MKKQILGIAALLLCTQSAFAEIGVETATIFNDDIVDGLDSAIRSFDDVEVKDVGPIAADIMGYSGIRTTLQSDYFMSGLQPQGGSVTCRKDRFVNSDLGYDNTLKNCYVTNTVLNGYRGKVYLDATVSGKMYGILKSLNARRSGTSLSLENVTCTSTNACFVTVVDEAQQ